LSYAPTRRKELSLKGPRRAPSVGRPTEPPAGGAAGAPRRGLTNPIGPRSIDTVLVPAAGLVMVNVGKPTNRLFRRCRATDHGLLAPSPFPPPEIRAAKRVLGLSFQRRAQRRLRSWLATRDVYKRVSPAPLTPPLHDPQVRCHVNWAVAEVGAVLSEQ